MSEIVPRPPARRAATSVVRRADRRRVGGRPGYPRHLIIEYRRVLRALVDEVRGRIDRQLRPVLRDIATDVDDRHERGDSVASDLGQIISVIEQVRASYARYRPPEETLRRIYQGVDGYATAQTHEVISQAIGVDVYADPLAASVYHQWADDNARLIRSIPEQYLADVRDRAEASLRAGESTASLADAIESRYGVARSRADLIAADQVGKLNGQIQRRRQEEVGVEEYIWSDSGDERVRGRHAALDGRRFRWDDPPVTNKRGDRNHPGGDYRCRCTAEPVLEDDDVDELQEAARQRRSVGEMRRERAAAERRREAEQAALARQRRIERERREEQRRAELAADIDPDMPAHRRYRIEVQRGLRKHRQSDMPDVESLQGDPQEDWRDLQWEWVHGTNRRGSVAMKHAVRDEFDFVDGPIRDRRNHAARTNDEYAEHARRAVRHRYEMTQEQLREQGVGDTVRLHRAVVVEQGRPLDPFGALESWTDSKDVALELGEKVRARLRRENLEVRLLTEDVPTSHVLSWHGDDTWQTGAFGEQDEWVVMGGWEA